MNKKIKQLLKKHINIVKSMYPELYIEVEMVLDDILVSINSLEIYNGERFADLLCNFIDEYDSKGYFDIYWGVNSSLTGENLELLEDIVEVPKKENSKENRVVNF